MVNNPYSDDTPKGQVVIPRGEFHFLQVAIRESRDGPLTPPDTFDSTNIRAILDPDGVDVTDSWATNQLDPDDDNDDFDETHPDYVGDQASPDNIGLFHDGSGRVAQKVEVPSDAEITTNDDTRSYEIQWTFTVNSNTVSDSEIFNVASSGVLVFQATVITPEEVTIGLNTSLTNDDIRELISEATREVRGWVMDVCGVDPDTDSDFSESVPPLVRNAIIKYTRGLIFNRDLSTQQAPVSSVRQGRKRVDWAVESKQPAETLFGRSKDDILDYCDGRRSNNSKTIKRKRWTDVF